MAGLVPAIHVFIAAKGSKTWMAATRAAVVGARRTSHILPNPNCQTAMSSHSRGLILPERQSSLSICSQREGAERRKGALVLSVPCEEHVPALRSASSPYGAPPRRY